MEKQKSQKLRKFKNFLAMCYMHRRVLDAARSAMANISLEVVELDVDISSWQKLCTENQTRYDDDTNAKKRSLDASNQLNEGKAIYFRLTLDSFITRLFHVRKKLTVAHHELNCFIVELKEKHKETLQNDKDISFGTPPLAKRKLLHIASRVEREWEKLNLSARVSKYYDVYGRREVRKRVKSECLQRNNFRKHCVKEKQDDTRYL